MDVFPRRVELVEDYREYVEGFIRIKGADGERLVLGSDDI